MERLEDRRLLTTLSISDTTAIEGKVPAFVDVPINAQSSPVSHPKGITKGPDGDFFVTRQ